MSHYSEQRENDILSNQPSVEILQGDCMDYMRNLPDNAFDLAIVDPPYGIDAAKRPIKSGKWKRDIHKPKEWDSKPPDSSYFKELIRVSKNQIIWGGNYFLNNLGPTPCFIVWDKKLENGWLADCELAWTSFKTQTKKFTRHHIEDHNQKIERIHPTQKPVKLYEWLLTKYAKKGQRILDTHLGSGSSAIAAHYFGVDFVGIELDEDYYKAAKDRFSKATAQNAFDFGDDAA